jgi:hypothetical protein
MTLFGLELVIIKVIASALAHAGPAAATNASMHGATAALAAASSAGTVGGAATAVGGSAYAGYKIADEMEKERNMSYRSPDSVC